MTDTLDLDAFWDDRPDIQKYPWMETKEMLLVSSIEELNQVIDEK